MLSAIVRGSLRHRVVVLTAAALLVAAGLRSVQTAPYDVFPEFVPPMVVVQTEAPGFGSEDVELLVTRPIEALLSGIAGQQSLRSTSMQGLSVVTAIFRDGSDVRAARQQVGERLSQLAGQLPIGVDRPALAPLTSSSGIVYRLGLTSRTRTVMELRTLADGTIRPRLLAAPGVSSVTTFGGEIRQLHVTVQLDRLLAYELAIDDILDAVRQSTGRVGAGFVEDLNQRITVTTEIPSLTVEQLADMAVVTRDGLPIRLSQVAEVSVGAAPKFGDASIGEQPAVILVLYQQLGANTLDVTRAVEAAVAALRPALPDDVELLPLFRQASLIERSIANVGTALLEGAALVIVVLFVFLANVRTACISLTAIPLSLLAAVAVLHGCGQTINTLTLGGLAIAVGEVVDDAIIDVENIYRRLRQHAGAADPLRIVLSASIEVRSAVVFATVIVALVFVPIFGMTGLQGSLFRPLGYAYVLAILASLVVALIVTPALAAVLLVGRPLATGDTRLLSGLKRAYEWLLRPTLRHATAVGAAAFALCVAGISVLPFLGGELIPELHEGSYSIHMAGLPGTSLAESLRVGARVQREIAALPAVESVSQQVGRAELSEDVWGSNYSELMLELKPLDAEQTEQALDQLRRLLARYPGYYFSIKPFLTERIEEVVSGATAEVAARVFGPDLDELDRLAAAVARVAGDIRGAADVAVERSAGTPEWRVRVRPDECARHGVRPLQVLEIVRAAVHGQPVAQVPEGSRLVDLVVRTAGARPGSIAAIADLPVATPAGGRVPLRQLADIGAGETRSLIAHDAAGRRALVQCNVRDRDVEGFVSELRQAVVARVPLPPGYHFEWGGEAEAARRARREILTAAALVLVAIAVLLQAAFGSWRLAALVLANLPFALVGGVAAVLGGGGVISTGALVGFVTLFGISTRNSIMLVSHYQHLVLEEGAAWGEPTIIRGAVERLGPILMTALVTALGLAPIALGGAAAGREIEQPMAQVILGGLTTSTLLNLLVLPALVGRFGRSER